VRWISKPPSHLRKSAQEHPHSYATGKNPPRVGRSDWIDFHLEIRKTLAQKGKVKNFSNERVRVEGVQAVAK
jgi:hypothetical protein